MPLGFDKGGKGYLVQKKDGKWVVMPCRKKVVVPDEPFIVTLNNASSSEAAKAIEWQNEWQRGADSVWDNEVEAKARIAVIETAEKKGKEPIAPGVKAAPASREEKPDPRRFSKK